MNKFAVFLASLSIDSIVVPKREKPQGQFQVGLCCKLCVSLNLQFCGVCMCASKRTQLKMFQKG